MFQIDRFHFETKEKMKSVAKSGAFLLTFQLDSVTMKM